MSFPPANFGPSRCVSAASILSAAGCLLLATSCDRHLPDKLEIPETRATFSTEGDIPAPVSSVLRFGSASESRFTWEAPPGWKLMPVSQMQMRELSFAFGPQSQGECYLSLTNGGTGATLAELNRWRTKQMNLPPVDASAIDALPTQKLFNHPTPMVDLSGDFTPAMAMGLPEGAPKPPSLPNFRLVGLILEIPDRGAVVTLKMVGPKDIIESQIENFKTFAASIGVAGAQ